MSAEKTAITTVAGLGSIGGIWAAVHTAAPEGVCYSAGTLAITTILVVLLISAIIALFWLLIAEKDAQIKELRRLAYRGTELTERSLKLAAKETAE